MGSHCSSSLESLTNKEERSPSCPALVSALVPDTLGSEQFTHPREASIAGPGPAEPSRQEAQLGESKSCAFS